MKKFILIFAMLPFCAAAAETEARKESLFFTPNQIASIMRANQGFIAPEAAYNPDNQSGKPIDKGPRNIVLSGIVYNAPNDWTIWLNGQRVTPKNKPERVMGLTVRQDRIHLRWMDIGNQRIVNITLRPHQVYALDTDTIRPGK